MLVLTCEIKIDVEDEERLRDAIRREYGEVNQDTLTEYLNEHIRCRNTSGAFAIRGAETDGWLIETVNGTLTE